MKWMKKTKNEGGDEKKVEFASFSQKMSAVKQFANEKVSWHAIPEHDYDALPVGSDGETKKFADSLPRFDISTLLSLSDEKEMKKMGEMMIEQLNKHGVVVLKLDENYKKISEDFNQSIKQFFDQKIDDKMTFRAPGEKRSTYSGYSTIIFDNRDSIRDPEVRDIFQMRLAEKEKIPWPSSEIQQTATVLYTQQFHTSLSLLSCLSLGMGWGKGVLGSLLDEGGKGEGEGDGERGVRVDEAQNTNMCAFHYWDHFGYKNEQRCMIHQDRGLVTLLPPPSAPGLHLLDPRASSPSASQWLPLDKEIKEDEMLFYCGLAMEFITSGIIPSSFHRVVRQPLSIRYSCPFEAKPYDSCLLSPPPLPSSLSPSPSFPSCSFPSPLPESMTAKELYVQADWERIQSKVSRQDNARASPSPSPSSSSSPSPSCSSSQSYEGMDKSCFAEGREEAAMMVDVDA